ncbi:MULTISPECIES: lipoyl protein ligase domain-containing protein [unclassified Halobacteriovorax]|uniref:lipoyl protein ligase domain-containing protein n=1 Tax=unclassified Halobacteriovorax TaxID=2639665 RepID=UPI003999A9BD
MTFNNLINDLGIKDYSLESKNQIYIFHKDNWDYLEALAFQEKANEYIYNNPEQMVYIITSHPEVFTMGRGLQRDQIEEHGLVDFDQALVGKIDVPVVEIKRGGGLTFHHPGQVIVYPIVHIGQQKLRTIELINKLFKSTVNAINTSDNTIHDLDFDRPLLGLWHGEKKVASMGIQLKRFVSMHGMALNIYPSEKMNKALIMTFPCGLPGDIYNTLVNISSDGLNTSYEEYRMRFINQLVKEIYKN